MDTAIKCLPSLYQVTHSNSSALDGQNWRHYSLETWLHCFSDRNIDIFSSQGFYNINNNTVISWKQAYASLKISSLPSCKGCFLSNVCPCCSTCSHVSVEGVLWKRWDKQLKCASIESSPLTTNTLPIYYSMFPALSLAFSRVLHCEEMNSDLGCRRYATDINTNSYWRHALTNCIRWLLERNKIWNCQEKATYRIIITAVYLIAIVIFYLMCPWSQQLPKLFGH